MVTKFLKNLASCQNPFHSSFKPEDLPMEPDLPRENPNKNQNTAATRAISYIGETFSSLYRVARKRVPEKED